MLDSEHEALVAGGVALGLRLVDVAQEEGLVEVAATVVGHHHALDDAFLLDLLEGIGLAEERGAVLLHLGNRIVHLADAFAARDEVSVGVRLVVVVHAGGQAQHGREGEGQKGK